MIMWRRIFYILITIVFPAMVFSQHDLQITVSSPLVQNPEVTYSRVDLDKIKVVVTEYGLPVGGLSKENFAIATRLSRGEVRKVESLLQTEIANVSMILCVDNSSSMGKHVDFVRATLNDLLDGLGPSVKLGSVFALEGFSSLAGAVKEIPANIKYYPLTKNKQEIRKTFDKHLIGPRLSARTFLYDEIFTAITLLSQIEDEVEQRFVIVLSDGEDNASQYEKEDINKFADENSKIAFYTIDFLQKTNPFLFQLSKRSFGRHFQAKKAHELTGIFEDISQDMVKLSGYLITYKIPQAILAGRVEGAYTCELLREAQVFCYPEDAPEEVFKLAVDELGTYRYQAALPHRWIVKASAPGFIEDSAVVNVTDEDIYLADITLAPAIVVLRGRVMDSGTVPLAEAQVIVTDLESGVALFEGETDSLGVYEFEVQAGKELLITCTKDGYTYDSFEVNHANPQSFIPDVQLGLTAEGFVSEFRFLFALNSARLDLNDVATQAQLKGCIDIIQRELTKNRTRMVRLEGWTDSQGAVEYNLKLSQRRALFVKKYLEQKAIPGERIVAKGRGVSYKYDNATSEGRKLNRRTDMIFFDRQDLTDKSSVQKND